MNVMLNFETYDFENHFDTKTTTLHKNKKGQNQY